MSGENDDGKVGLMEARIVYNTKKKDTVAWIECNKACIV